MDEEIDHVIELLESAKRSYGWEEWERLLLKARDEINWLLEQ